MKIGLTEFVTLDGVSQGPGSPTEDTTDGFTRGGWLVPYLDELFVRRTSEWLDLADGLLLGRRTYQAFARDWPQITDPDDRTPLAHVPPRLLAAVARRRRRDRSASPISTAETTPGPQWTSSTPARLGPPQSCR
ncbi:hypothetical protein GCM10022225_20590 [Plantactinospora mayteni]|uniref:Bacterial bifunctional deaminase-reductase C-terminal domain-containing protein n=1 Tax=Plantactinospora mayteni TaxID=566021 RepID=A0ABQ4ENM7_9ACTN|nr:hypothetical protein [Plantactinospora mayteni]GIG96240.1 hypothetical protein Pma05_28130 [Plantactinospora mayteni]